MEHTVRYEGYDVSVLSGRTRDDCFFEYSVWIDKPDALRVVGASCSYGGSRRVIEPTMLRVAAAPEVRVAFKDQRPPPDDVDGRSCIVVFLFMIIYCSRAPSEFTQPFPPPSRRRRPSNHVCLFLFFGPRKRSGLDLPSRAVARKGKTTAAATFTTRPVPFRRRRRRTEAVALVPVVPRTRNSAPANGRSARTTTRTRFTLPEPTTASAVRDPAGCLCRRRRWFAATAIRLLLQRPPRLWTREREDTAACTRPQRPTPRTPVTGSGTACPPALCRRTRSPRRPPPLSFYGEWRLAL